MDIENKTLGEQNMPIENLTAFAFLCLPLKNSIFGKKKKKTNHICIEKHDVMARGRITWGSSLNELVPLETAAAQSMSCLCCKCLLVVRSVFMPKFRHDCIPEM